MQQQNIEEKKNTWTVSYEASFKYGKYTCIHYAYQMHGEKENGKRAHKITRYRMSQKQARLICRTHN